MPIKLALTAVAALVLGLGITAAGHAAPAAAPFQCEIRTTPGDGMVAIEGLVHAPLALSGSYELTITSQGPGGSSDISQGGNLNAGPGDVAIGKVTLGSAGATYDVTLKVTANGHTVQCQGRFGSQI